MVLYSMGPECMIFHMVLYSLGPECMHLYICKTCIMIECMNFHDKIAPCALNIAIICDFGRFLRGFSGAFLGHLGLTGRGWSGLGWSGASLGGPFSRNGWGRWICTETLPRYISLFGSPCRGGWICTETLPRYISLFGCPSTTFQPFVIRLAPGCGSSVFEICPDNLVIVLVHVVHALGLYVE